ncbi:MAG: hypothetical protein WC412_04270 [Candidatus Omnitrophota bacterium]|jgi:hypothetical protein
MDYPIKMAKFIFLVFFIACGLSNVSAEDRDIKLRLRDSGLNVPVAVCSAACPVSPLKIRKGGNTYGIKLVGIGDSSATKIQVKTTAGTKAVKKYVPMTGSLKIERANLSGRTWLSTITCRCSSGSTSNVKIKYGNSNPFLLYSAVRSITNAPSNDIQITLPRELNGDNDGVFRRTTSSGVDTYTLGIICNIFGYDVYVSSESYSAQYDRSNFHSTGDNSLGYFKP